VSPLVRATTSSRARLKIPNRLILTKDRSRYVHQQTTLSKFAADELQLCFGSLAVGWHNASEHDIMGYLVNNLDTRQVFVGIY
jgi:hypothetical protein